MLQNFIIVLVVNPFYCPNISQPNNTFPKTINQTLGQLTDYDCFIGYRHFTGWFYFHTIAYTCAVDDYTTGKYTHDTLEYCEGTNYIYLHFLL